MEKSMKSIVKKSMALAAACLIFTGAAYAQTAQPLKAKALVKPNVMQRVIINKPGINPAVNQLTVTNGAAGRLAINATIKNVGTENFVSGPGQASAVIQVYDSSASGPGAYKTIATRTFTNLAAGASFVLTAAHTLEYFVEWSDTTLDSGECDASRQIIAMIMYDPDISADGNPKNDDVQSSNNVKKKMVKYVVECPW